MGKLEIPDVESVARGLLELAITQEEVGSVIPGWVEGEPEFIRTTFLSLMVETSELLQEFNWKQWKKPTSPDHAKMADEFADMLAFLGYIVKWLGDLGISPLDLAEAYKDKTEVNKKRLAGKVSGYGI